MGARGTLKDIAAAVGVPPATVSLVLNDKPVRISSERREQILNVASSMHYRPNQTARAATGCGGMPMPGGVRGSLGGFRLLRRRG